MNEPHQIGKSDAVSDDQITQQMHDIHLFANNDMRNIQNIKHKIRKDIEKNEVLLDLHCEEISRDIDADQLIESTAESFAINDEMRGAAINPDQSPTSKPWNKSSLSPNSEQQTKARRPSSLPRFNINSSGRTIHRIPIDPQKKSKLLAQLKSIEAANANL